MKWITNEKPPKCEKRGPKQIKKKPLVCDGRAETRRQCRHGLSQLGTGIRDNSRLSSALHMSASDQESIMSADLGLTEKCQQVDEFAKTARGNKNRPHREIIIKVITHLLFTRRCPSWAWSSSKTWSSSKKLGWGTCRWGTNGRETFRCKFFRNNIWFFSQCPNHFKKANIKNWVRDFPDGPVVKNLPCIGTWIQSLVRELRSQMLQSS